MDGGGLRDRVAQALNDLPGDFRRADTRVQLLIVAIVMMAGFLLLMSLSALLSGELGAWFALLFVVAVLLGLSFLLLRRSGDAERALNAALSGGMHASDPVLLESPRTIAMIAYEHDGWVYGMDGKLPGGVLVVDAQRVVFTGSSRRRAGVLRDAMGHGALGLAADMAADGVDAVSRAFRFEFPRDSIVQVFAPRAAQDLVLVTPSGPHRFKVVADAWVETIEAFARHRYPLARAADPLPW